MKHKILTWLLPILLLVVIVVFTIEESRTVVVGSAFSFFYFLKENLLTLLTAFFLVKGKFVLTLFLKKIAILSTMGLGKRYLIEKVLTHHFKIHFLDHIKDDVKKLLHYVKNNFKEFPLIKQIIAGFVFLGSLGFVGKMMGGMLAMKVFVAKVWSFLLALFLKIGTGLIYFFTDYLWNSWIAPIVEVVIFSWILSWMEKVPFLAKMLSKVSKFFLSSFRCIEIILERVFHLPMERFFRWLVKKVQDGIYDFITPKKISRWEKLQNYRDRYPSRAKKLKQKRAFKAVANKEKSYQNAFAKLKEKREAFNATQKRKKA